MAPRQIRGRGAGSSGVGAGPQELSRTQTTVLPCGALNCSWVGNVCLPVVPRNCEFFTRLVSSQALAHQGTHTALSRIAPGPLKGCE